MIGKSKFGQVFAFFIFLMIMIVLISVGVSGLRRLSPNLSTGRKSAYGNSDSSPPWYKQIWNDLKNMASPLGSKAYTGLPREAEPKGRCDNIKWLSIKNGNSAICVDAGLNMPPPERFTIDLSRLNGFSTLPYKTKGKILENEGKLSIIVPYMYHKKPSSYVLDFKNARFQDGTSAKHLFDQKFDYNTWRFVSKTVPQYKARERKTPRGDRGLDKYIPLPKPNFNLIKVLTSKKTGQDIKNFFNKKVGNDFFKKKVGEGAKKFFTGGFFKKKKR